MAGKYSWTQIHIGRLRTFYWKYLRTRPALALRIWWDEYDWSHKSMPQDEVWEYVDDIKGQVRY